MRIIAELMTMYLQHYEHILRNCVRQFDCPLGVGAGFRLGHLPLNCCERFVSLTRDSRNCLCSRF